MGGPVDFEATSTIALLDECYALVARVAGSAGDDALLRASGCAGWNAADLLVHMLMDARRALVTMATPVPGPPDTDAVTYWQPADAAGSGAAAHAVHVRRLAVAYSRPAAIVQEWRDTAPAAVRAVAAGDSAGCVATQGHVMTVADFASTLLVEVVVHLLDLAVALPAAVPPEPALAHAAARISAVVNVEVPPAWSDADVLTAFTGRRPLTGAERAALGPAARELPLQL